MKRHLLIDLIVAVIGMVLFVFILLLCIAGTMVFLWQEEPAALVAMSGAVVSALMVWMGSSILRWAWEDYLNERNKQP